MNAITLGASEIRQLDGLFSLNDLHAAAGGESKHRPSYFLSNEQTKALVTEIEIAGIPAISARQKIGTYACRELVIAYAAWISAAFHLKVIRVFLASVAPALPQYISAAQQNALQQIVAQRAGESGGLRAYFWSRLNNHFRLGSYKQLPVAQFDEAKSYLENLPDKRTAPALPAPASLSDEAEQLLISRLRLRRHFTTFGSDGSITMTPVPDDAYVMTMAEFEEMLKRMGKMIVPTEAVRAFQSLLGAPI